jgi:predicted nucleotidyltransferase
MVEFRDEGIEYMKRRKRFTVAEKEILVKRISGILKEKDYILFAYIFGSFALNSECHDIDVAIYISDGAILIEFDEGKKGEGESYSERGKRGLQLEFEIEKELEDVARIPADVRLINGAPLSFIYNVLRSGVVIVDKDISMRSDFEGLVYKKYFDYKYLQREYLREIINAPI